MKLFKYQAVDKHGAKFSGELSAADESQVRMDLQRRQLIPIAISAATESRSAVRRSTKVSFKELEYFTNELSLLLGSGVKVDKAIDIIIRSETTPALRQLLTKLSQDLKAGKSLSDCFAAHPQYFDNMYCNLIRVGEATGELPSVFNKLAEDIKFKSNLRAKILQALVYPAIISTICILAIVFILNYVIPQMSSLFEDAANLPVYTSMLLGLSEWFVQYQWFLYIGVAVAVYIVWSNRDSARLHATMYQFLESVPLLNNMVIMVERIRFTSAMSLMMSSGVKVTNAMTLACESVKSGVVRASLTSAIEKVKQGQSLTTAMGGVSIFQGMYLSLLEIGEETSELERVFTEIAQRSQTSFESWIAKATNLIEPLMIVLMGLIVGTVVVVMLLSVTSVNDLQF